LKINRILKSCLSFNLCNLVQKFIKYNFYYIIITLQRGLEKMRLIYFTFLLIYSSQVFAYLDPGSASLIIQGLIAAVAFGITTISFYWSKLKSFFGFKPSDKKNEKEENES